MPLVTLLHRGPGGTQAVSSKAASLWAGLRLYWQPVWQVLESFEVGSGLPVPEVIVFQSNTHDIRGGPDRPLCKGVGLRFDENMDFQPS